MRHPISINIKKGFLPALLFLMLMPVVACLPSNEFLIKRNLTDKIDNQYVRVLLLKTKNNFTISSSGRLKINEKNSGKLKYDTRNADLTFNPEKITTPLIIESGNTYLKLNGSPYRGFLELHNILGTVHVINVIKIEEYLLSVVPSEIPSGWEDEALKAQAVAARTYTYHFILNNRVKGPYDLDSTTKFQVYKGVEAEKESTTAAVEKTSGQIISYQYKPIVAYFHSTCGGRTADDKFVWTGTDLSYLRSVKCPYCKQSTKYTWETKVTLAEIRDCISKKYNGIGGIERISFKKLSGRIVEVYIKHSNGSITITGNNFRLLFPADKIRSLYFSSKKYRYGLVLSGHGWGHGVGMCQWGARGMAKRGHNYKSILRHYYKGVSIHRVKSSVFANTDKIDNSR